MTQQLSYLNSILSILALWIAFDAGYRRYRIDILRNRLFRLRSELFEAARKGHFGVQGFRDPTYLRIRRGLNGFIRYGHQFTLFRLLVLQEYRGLLAPLEEDATGRLDRDEQRSMA